MTKPQLEKSFVPAVKAQVSPAAPRPSDMTKQEARARLGTMRDLAALQLLYGQPEQAKKLLAVALWIDDRDGHAMRLTAHCYARLNQPLRAGKFLVAAHKSGTVKVLARDWGKIGLAILVGGKRELAMEFLNKRDAV